jgi:hypothetical protein
MVFSQTAAEGGNAAADTLTSGANETIATATATDGDNNMTEAKFLFIQGAQSGSVSEVNATTSTLELNDVSDKTILFSDRLIVCYLHHMRRDLFLFFQAFFGPCIPIRRHRSTNLLII